MAGPRGRIVAAAALATGLIVVVALLVSSGSGEEAVVAAPEDCLRDWNADAVSRERARHVLTFHGYPEAQASEEGGACVVAFPASVVDPEQEYAGFTGRRSDWDPLSETRSPEELGALQSAAITDANVTITPDGRLRPK